MYAIAECITLLGLSALVGSLLLSASVVVMMAREGVATVWRMSRRIAGSRSR
jgi:hypothetical protein